MNYEHNKQRIFMLLKVKRIINTNILYGKYKTYMYSNCIVYTK